MRWRLGVLIWACLFPSFSLAADERLVDLELVLAADISGSMDLEEAGLQRRGFANAIRHPDVIEAIKSGLYGRIAVTYVEWAGAPHQVTLVDWTEISDAKTAENFALRILAVPVATAAYTSISGVIEYGGDLFVKNGFKGTRRVIDISGDGPNNSGEYVNHARDRAVQNGIVINGLPIMNDRPSRYGLPPLKNLDLYYQDCVIGGFGAFVVVANGFQDFARAVRKKLILEIAGVPPQDFKIYRAAERKRPPCNAGEIQMMNRGLNDF